MKFFGNGIGNWYLNRQLDQKNDFFFILETRIISFLNRQLVKDGYSHFISNDFFSNRQLATSRVG